MKRIGIIVVSIFVLYAGASWALERCWDNEGQTDHPASETHHDSHSSLHNSHPSDDSFSLIHCRSFANRVGPAMTTATPKLGGPIEVISLDSSHSIVPAASMDLSRPALLRFFRRVLRVSFYSNLKHHLFLAVLQI